MPALGFFNVYPFRYSLVADHFQYHASLALIALAAAGATLFCRRWAPRSIALARGGAALVLVVLAVVTFRQTVIYDNPESLYRDTIAKNPRGWVAYTNLADFLESSGQDDDALPLARQAVQLKPDEPIVHSNLGTMLLRRGQANGFAAGQLDEIVAELERALELARTRPGLGHVAPAIQSNLGWTLLELGRQNRFQSGELQRTAAHLQEALRHEPRLCRRT